MVLGIAGALLGGLLGRAVGWYREGTAPSLIGSRFLNKTRRLPMIEIGERRTTSQIVHRDSGQPGELNYEERSLLVKFCWNHAVAECQVCLGRFRQQELAADLARRRLHLCPACRCDLTASLRAHLRTCAAVPAHVRCRPLDASVAARRLRGESDALSGRADVLTREAKAAITALREAIRRLTSGG